MIPTMTSEQDEICKTILERCIQYGRERRQFGRAIIDNQAVSHKIADMAVTIEMSRLLLYHIAQMKDDERNTYRESSIFKFFVSEHYVKVCRDALQIFGAYGYTEEYGIECELRDALASTIYSGTSEMQRNTIAQIEVMLADI